MQLTNGSSLKKMYFKLNPKDWHGYATESVWVESLSGDRYRIKNTPFHAMGVSFEDIVFGSVEHDKLYFDSVSIRSGHSTYRILMKKAVLPKSFEQYWQPLSALGCTYESAEREHMRLFAVDVPPSVDIYKVYALLEEGQRADVWDFEEGHCGHLLKPT